MAHAVEPIRIGISALSSVAESQQQWSPLAQSLKRAIPDQNFVIETHPPSGLKVAIESRQLDFVLMESSLQVLMAHQIGISAPLGTLINSQMGIPTPAYGGVIFSSSRSRPLINLASLANTRIAVTDTASLGGYQMQAYELLLAGMPQPDPQQLVLTGWPEERVVEAVLSGKADVGFVRSGLLERLVQQGKFDWKSVRLINPNNLPGFPNVTSTRLYPEWSFSALPHVDDNLARKVVAVLFNLSETDPATVKAIGIQGFSIPANYLPVGKMLETLRAPPFDTAPEFTTGDVLKRYKWPIAAAAVMMLALVSLGFALLVNNRRLYSERAKVEKQAHLLTESEAKLQSLVDSSATGIFWSNEAGDIEYTNDQFTNLFGYSHADIPSLQTWYEKAFPDPAYRQTLVAGWEASTALARNRNTPIHQREVKVTCKDGSERHVILAGSWAGPRLMVNFSDISERKLAEETIQKQANFDSLTGLPNRRLFRDRLEQSIKQSARTNHPSALMLIDLDYFKEVNDTLGHDQGDILLIEAAKRISQCVRDSDTVARLGGDEFTVILPDLKDNHSVEAVAQKMVQALSAPFQLTHEKGYISASIGIALFPDDANTAEDLIKHADQAMYDAKAQGRNGYRYFTQALQESAKAKMRLTSELRNALALDQFHLVYQPIVELATGHVHKGEALIRWQHPELGLVSPASFIPIAEDTGLIVDIGDWVFKTATTQVKEFRARYNPDFQISINKSPVQFRNENGVFLNWHAHLQSLGLPGQCVCIEITEGLLLDAESRVREELFAFRDSGIQVAIDDFGTGYSSLAYLKKFDLDYLKIDRAFVQNLEHGKNDQALCSAIIMMAHTMGFKVVAEGVETEAQRALLLQAGCDYAQGFLFSRPVSAGDFDALLQRQVAQNQSIKTLL
jgi:diguanylate cyclase (GGDEF)-like protein/PAS domain S-box-containing protein